MPLSYGKSDENATQKKCFVIELLEVDLAFQERNQKFLATLFHIYYKHDSLNVYSVLHFDVGQHKRGLEADVSASEFTLIETAFSC